PPPPPPSSPKRAAPPDVEAAPPPVALVPQPKPEPEPESQADAKAEQPEDLAPPVEPARRLQPALALAAPAAAISGTVSATDALTGDVDAMSQARLGAFVGEVAPEPALKSIGIKTPKYVAAALELMAQATRRTKQDLVARALRELIDDRLLD